MRILQLVTKRQYRGAEVFAANLSEELIGFGHEIIFAGLYKNDKDVLTVENARNIDLTDELTSSFSFQLLHNIINLIKFSKPDVVQCNGSDTLKYMVAASYFIPKTPIVYRNISMISEWISNKPKKLLYNNLFKRVSHVSSVGEEAIADLIKTFNYPVNQTSVIRRGIPNREIDQENARLNLQNQFNLESDAKIVMHIGNFSPEKNHIFLLDIFSGIKINHPSIKLVLVGNGVLYETIEEEVVKRQLEDTVFLTGFRKDIPELLAASDLFVLCSKVEGVPGVILEAAVQKKPSISTNVGGVKEVLESNKTGFIIDDFNKQDFISKIIKLSTDDKLRKSLGENACSLVSKEFNPIKNARKFEKLYADLSGSKITKNYDEKKKLRILQIIQKKQFRGAEIFCCQLTNHLIDLGNEVEIISIYEGDVNLPFSKEIKSLSGSKSIRFFDISGWRKLAKLIEEFNPDIIQANAADTLKYTVFSKLIFGWNVPIVYRNASASSYYIKNSITRKLNSYLLEHVDLIISVSQASKRDLNQTFSFTTSKSVVIPIGINPFEKVLDWNSAENSKEKDYSILHVGSFTSEKNHLGLLEIFRRVLKSVPNAKLHLVGLGPLKQNIEERVKKMELETSVIFYGGVDNPLDYISRSNVLVLPSKIEGLPGVLLEAMYCKTPVIAYDVGGVSEIVSPETGILINQDDEIGFAEAVVETLKTQDSIRIEAAYKFVKANFMNREIAQQFLKAYKSIL